MFPTGLDSYVYGSGGPESGFAARAPMGRILWCNKYDTGHLIIIIFGGPRGDDRSDESTKTTGLRRSDTVHQTVPSERASCDTVLGSQMQMVGVGIAWPHPHTATGPSDVIVDKRFDT